MIRYWLIDTNVLISALLLNKSKAAEAVLLARKTGTLIVSTEIVHEYSRVLLSEKFDKYVSKEIRYEFLHNIVTNALPVDISQKVEVCRDPTDDKFLSLAVSAGAEAIITGDKDLLELHPFQNIPILNPSDFIRQITTDNE